jgi:hypothetical protein
MRSLAALFQVGLFIAVVLRPLGVSASGPALTGEALDGGAVEDVIPPGLAGGGDATVGDELRDTSPSDAENLGRLLGAQEVAHAADVSGELALP